VSTLKTGWGKGLSLILGLLAGGCGAPPSMVDTVPPGVDPRVGMMEQRKDEAEALGEAATGRGKSSAPAPAMVIPPALPTAKGEKKTTESGITYETIKEGTGAVVKSGDRIMVHYTGTFDDGRVFDTSKGKDTFKIQIGTAQVIRGWDEAIPGMKIGEIRKMTIPPAAGYGAQGKGPVPPNATLHFEVELVNTQ
jgi:FKBP-type peptidyl-prolyl cis-trans isomerase